MKIEFIISTHGRVNNLNMSLGCLQSQTNKNWVANIIVDGIKDPYIECEKYFSNDFVILLYSNGEWYYISIRGRIKTSMYMHNSIHISNSAFYSESIK